MNRYPGAIWRPTGDNGPMGQTPDVTSLHEAVSAAEQSIYGWTVDAKACHAYNGKDGYFEQYVNFDRKVSGVAEGNGHVTTIESYDGLHIQQNPYREIGSGGLYGTSSDTGRWDAGQCERFSDLLAWQHLDYGLDLRVMQTSRRGETGVAPHRLGIAPWRVPGGEVWTRHDGKRCPGDLRVEQIPDIVARAQQIAAAVKVGRAGWLPAGAVDVNSALRRGAGTSTAPSTATPSGADTGVLDMNEAQLRKLIHDEVENVLYNQHIIETNYSIPVALKELLMRAADVSKSPRRVKLK